MKKKLLMILLASIMTISLVACGQAEDDVDTSNGTVESNYDMEESQDRVENVVTYTPTPVATSVPTATPIPIEKQVIQWTNENIKSMVLSSLGRSEGEVTFEEAASINGFNTDENGEVHITFGIYYSKDEDLSDLKYLSSLEGLYIHGRLLDSINFVEYLPNLKYFSIESEEVTDLSPLQNCELLESLTVKTYGLQSLEGIRGLTNLKYLDINTDILSDINAISTMNNLEEFTIKTNALETVNIDFSNLMNLDYVYIRSERLTDATSFSTFVINENIDLDTEEEQQIIIINASLNEESYKVLAQKEYDGYKISAVQGYGSSSVDVKCDGVTSYVRDLEKEFGKPEVVREMPQGPSVEMATTWADMAIDFDGQLISAKCTLQNLFDYGYEIENSSIDITRRIEPGEGYGFYMKKENGVRIYVGLTNISDIQAMKIGECKITRISIKREEYDDEYLPELFLPTDIELWRKYDKYANYISWNSNSEEILTYSMGYNLSVPDGKFSFEKFTDRKENVRISVVEMDEYKEYVVVFLTYQLEISQIILGYDVTGNDRYNFMYH